MKKSPHGETPGPVLTSQVFCACGSLLGHVKNQAEATVIQERYPNLKKSIEKISLLMPTFPP